MSKKKANVKVFTFSCVFIPQLSTVRLSVLINPLLTGCYCQSVHPTHIARIILQVFLSMRMDQRKLVILQLHLSSNCRGYWGTTDDFTTTFLHFSLFSTAIWNLANSRPIHSLILSSSHHCTLQDGFGQT